MGTSALSMLLAVRLAVAAPDPTTDVQRIRIDYRHGGWGVTEETYIITSDAAGFHGEGSLRNQGEIPEDKSTKTYSRRHIDAAAVAGFMAQLQAPPMDQDTAISQIASPEWLATHAESMFDGKYNDRRRACSPESRRVFVDRYRDPASAKKAMGEYLNAGFWSDDYPSARILVTFADGRTIEARSGSQKVRMLPWEVGSTKTWNASLMPAIASLLPEDSSMRERFSSMDARLPRDFLLYTEGLESKVEDIEARCRHADQVARLEKSFEIRHAWDNGSKSLSALLRRADLPANLEIQMVTFSRGQFRKFESKIDKYIALAIPYARAHPANSIEVMFYKESSLDIYDYDLLVDDQAAVKRLAKAADDVAVVRDSGEKSISGYVFLLPSGEVMRPDSSTE